MRRSGFKRRNKYGAIKTAKDGILFDSKLESLHYEYLKMRQLAKEISDLEMQVEIPLKIGSVQIGIYVADFAYKEQGKYVISEAKGIETDVFKIKWKIAKALYPDWVFELRKKWKVTRQ